MNLPETRQQLRHGENEPHQHTDIRPIHVRSAQLDRPPHFTPPPWSERRPPSGAIILIGEDLSQWQHSDGRAAEWIVGDTDVQVAPGSGDIFTRVPYGDVLLHVEYASPEEVTSSGQGRGNSGVFFGGGRYEVQILDNFNNQTYPQGYGSGIYGQEVPQYEVSRKPGQWQTLDMHYRRPRFGEVDEPVEPARLTVIHNEILVVDAFALPGPTGQYNEPYSRHEDRLPISLQEHDSPVRFRKGGTWLIQLE